MMHARTDCFRRALIGLVAAVLTGAITIAVAVLPAAAQDEDLTTALAAITMDAPEITVTDDVVTVAFHDDVNSLGAWEVVLYKMANIINTAGTHPEGREVVALRITGTDGHTIEVTGSAEDAAAFISGDLMPHEYETKLIFTPITRGPVLVPGICESAAGQSCLDADACACYPNETCDPASADADDRGCVVDSAPENAHLDDGQYICDAGYIWNGDLTGCRIPLTCPAGTFKFNGECVERQGGGDAGGTGGSTGSGLGDDYSGGSSGLRVLLMLCAAGLCLLIPVALVVVLVVRRRRKLRAADVGAPTGVPVQMVPEVNVPGRTLPPPAAAPIGDPRVVTPGPIPPAPIPPPPLASPFLELEGKHAAISRDYAEGRLGRDAYRRALQGLVVQDARGHWSYSAGRWLWYDGAAWVDREPE